MSDSIPAGYFRNKDGILQQKVVEVSAVAVDYSPVAVKQLCYEAAVDALRLARQSSDARAIVALVRELLDRLEGKPV